MLGDIKRIIFDLNGTLVVGRYPDWNEVFEGRLRLRKKRDCRLTLRKLRLMAEGRVKFEGLISSLYEVDDPLKIREAAFKLYTSNVRLRDGATELLERLRESYELILCSDTTGIAKEVVERFNLKKYFVKLLYSCDLGCLKSTKKFWSKCLSHFPNSNPSQFLVVGDNPLSDVYWPKKMGVHTILIRSAISSSQDYVAQPKGSIEEEPEYFIESLREIWNYLAANPLA